MPPLLLLLVAGDAAGGGRAVEREVMFGPVRCSASPGIDLEGISFTIGVCFPV